MQENLNFDFSTNCRTSPIMTDRSSNTTSPFSKSPLSTLSPSTTDGLENEDPFAQSPVNRCGQFYQHSDQPAPSLHGPATFMQGDAIIVPPQCDEEEILDCQEIDFQPKNDCQRDEKEVLMIAEMAELPLHHPINDWDYKHKLNWMKCMLSKHLPQPQPEKVKERISKLSNVERNLKLNAEKSLETFIEIFADEFPDSSVIGELLAELNAWHRVCKSVQSESLPIKADRAASQGEKVAGDHLWEHILRLLMNEDKTVEWLDIEEGLFKFVDSSGAARSWGMTKNNPNMSYEKMSRSIRQYYTEGKDGIIQKANDYPKLHYRFNMYHSEVVNFLLKNFAQTCSENPFLHQVVTMNRFYK